DGRSQTRVDGFPFTHLACVGQQLERHIERSERPERLRRAGWGDLELSALARSRNQTGVIASLERETATDAGDRVDDEPEAHASPPRSARPPARPCPRGRVKPAPAAQRHKAFG